MPYSQVLFWICIGTLLYTYAGYPVLVWLWAKLFPQPHRMAPAEPRVTVVVAAHNEAAEIEARLENLLALEYPREHMDIVVASDGSTDATVERAKKFGNHGVRIVEFENRRGKPALLNALVPEARGDIVVLADARQRFHPGAVRALVRHFVDHRVGAVSGELVLVDDGAESGVSEGIGFYWEYEKFIRRHECLVDSTAGATGAIYAIRRELFEAIPEDTLLDDVVVPMRIVRRGFRVLFEEDAVACDRVSATPGAEFRRKVRTIAGNFQLFVREPWLLNPWRNRIWLQTLSHKAFRLLGPLALGTAFATNLMLLDQLFYVWTLGAQVVFYFAAAIGLAMPNTSRGHLLCNVPYAFCLLNWATTVAIVRVLSGRQQVTWDKGPG